MRFDPFGQISAVRAWHWLSEGAKPYRSPDLLSQVERPFRFPIAAEFVV